MMAHKLINIEKFWNELKRRKVIHVITGYAVPNDDTEQKEQNSKQKP
jgi:hypothetical protein